MESFKNRDNGNRIEKFENNNETSNKSNFILYGPPVLREDTGNLILISCKIKRGNKFQEVDELFSSKMVQQLTFHKQTSNLEKSTSLTRLGAK